MKHKIITKNIQVSDYELLQMNYNVFNKDTECKLIHFIARNTEYTIE